MGILRRSGQGLGYIESPKDDRDYILPLAAPSEPLPLVFSALEKTGPIPVLNQGKTSECVAYSGASLKTWEELLDSKKLLAFDTGWLYRECKRVDGFPEEDGTTVRAAMSVLKNKGVPLANRFGYGADRHKIAAYYRVPVDIYSLKLAIYQYGPIVTGSVWFESWLRPYSNGLYKGVLPKPVTKVGGHATIWYGWNDKLITPEGLGGFMGQSSWGDKWGVHGAFMVPYGYAKFCKEAFKAVDLLLGDEMTYANKEETVTKAATNKIKAI